MYVLKKDKNKKKTNAEYIQFCKIAIKFIIKKNILVIQNFVEWGVDVRQRYQ